MSKAYLNNNLLETILIIGINNYMYVGLYFIALGEDGVWSLAYFDTLLVYNKA